MCVLDFALSIVDLGRESAGALKPLSPTECSLVLEVARGLLSEECSTQEAVI